VSTRNEDRIARHTDEQILWLDISVNNMFPVEICQSICHLRDILGKQTVVSLTGNSPGGTTYYGCRRGVHTHPTTSLLLEPAQLGELLVQLSFCRELQHQEDPLRIVEVPV
jgi:hypothetical protein